MEEDRQLISIEDNAGGVSEENLANLVSPGGSNNKPGDEVIGYFGVGTKRAVVALAQDINIRSRYKNKETFQIDITDAWLESDSWDIPYYKVDNINQASTVVDLSRLRKPIAKNHEC